MFLQSFDLSALLTALENLTLGPMRLLGTPRRETERKVKETLRRVWLAERAGRGRRRRGGRLRERRPGPPRSGRT